MDKHRNFKQAVRSNPPPNHSVICVTNGGCVSGAERDLRLPPGAFQQVSALLGRSPEFTISAWLRQEVGNTGSIVSFAHGFNRYLELQSSGRKNEIRLHYTSRVDSKVYVETFHYRLADNLWHHVAVSVSGSQAELLVDCHPLYKRLLRPGAPDRNFTEPQQLWLGQRNKHYLFRVSSCPVVINFEPINRSSYASRRGGLIFIAGTDVSVRKNPSFCMQIKHLRCSHET